MNAKKIIRRALFIILWAGIAAGMFTLLIAAISSRKSERCISYRIRIKGSATSFFVSEKEIEGLLLRANGGVVTGRTVSSFRLHALEEELKSNAWISQAELYFDNRNVLHVNLTEREPLARLFTTAGNSFYIDSSLRQLPLSDQRSARVPVFTGFPSKRDWSRSDSQLLGSVRDYAAFIRKDPFWMSQVAQIDITPDRSFEMVPVLGQHLIRLGDGSDIEAKFRRLSVFYRQVLSRTGFDRYKSIDVQYRGQVVASRTQAGTMVDSVRLRRNVERLLTRTAPTSDSIVSAPVVSQPGIPLHPVTDTGRTTQPASETRAKNSKKAPEPPRKPKAVMPQDPDPDHDY